MPQNATPTFSGTGYGYICCNRCCYPSLLWQLRTKSAQPCVSTSIVIEYIADPIRFPLQTSQPIHGLVKFSLGSAFAISAIFADITVFLGFKLKKAKYISPAHT
uniref:Alpha-galactosidase n=1 Tax=Rhizophora mucronata TaxID=61149 RepID=A0A2P2L073_RHIMU